jgi:hypothetical protein
VAARDQDLGKRENGRLRYAGKARTGYTVIATGVPVDRPDLAVGIEDIMQLMDYDEMRELERRLLTTETLEAKYGTG